MLEVIKSQGRRKTSGSAINNGQICFSLLVRGLSWNRCKKKKKKEEDEH